MLTGIITVICILAIFYGWSVLRPTPPIDSDFGDRKISFSTVSPPDQVFQAVSNVLPGDRFKVGRADAAKGRVILEDGMTMSSYGFYYPVDIASAADGSTSVTVGVKSKFPLQFGPLVKRQQEKANQLMVELLRGRIEQKRVA